MLTLMMVANYLQCGLLLCLIVMYGHYAMTYYRPGDWWWSANFNARFSWINRTAVIAVAAGMANLFLRGALWSGMLADNPYARPYWTVAVALTLVAAVVVWWSLEVERLDVPEDRPWRDYH